MTTLVQVTAQYFENYGNPSDKPHWKAKGGQIFTFRAFADDFMYGKDECVKAIQLLLDDKSGSCWRYEYVDHELIFSEPEELFGFEEKLKIVLDAQNIQVNL
jgi:hypothetical protein